MSNTNYDVELNISYSNTYKHYVPFYEVAVPYYWYKTVILHEEEDVTSAESEARYQVAVSFDSQSEENIEYSWYYYTHGYPGAYKKYPPSPLYDGGNIQAAGVFSKCYLRNPHKADVTFTKNNCYLKVSYGSKAAFEVQLNSSGYIASTNASFKCSTVEKNIPVQYSWSSARVYYKKSTESTYSYVNGTVSGTWSDVTVNTNLSLATGYTYNIYIRATADDGTVANTAVANFATTDGPAIARCVSPVGTYTNGTVNFIWSHSTDYGTAQYAYDLQYSSDNGGTWTTVANHVISSVNNRTVTIGSAGVYLWRVRTYNTLDAAGSWAQASFINDIPAVPPANLTVTTMGRPTASWVSTTQAAYQVHVLLSGEVVYDSGAVYTGQNSHFINEYFDDTRAYTVRVRIYDSLGSASDWTSTGYQQPSVADVSFTVTQNGNGGAVIQIEDNIDFSDYYLKRNNVVIAKIPSDTRSYVDRYAIGLTDYAVVAITSQDQSDIKSQGFRVLYPFASIVTLDGAQYYVNKRVNEAVAIQTNNEADFNKAQFIGDSVPTHYFNKMKLKSFSVTYFDENGSAEDLLGTVVFYADNFGNGGYCIVTAYNKEDSFVKNGADIYANEVSLTLEVTNYDDSIEYPI